MIYHLLSTVVHYYPGVPDLLKGANQGKQRRRFRVRSIFFLLNGEKSLCWWRITILLYFCSLFALKCVLFFFECFSRFFSICSRLCVLIVCVNGLQSCFLKVWTVCCIFLCVHNFLCVWGAKMFNFVLPLFKATSVFAFSKLCFDSVSRFLVLLNFLSRCTETF